MKNNSCDNCVISQEHICKKPTIIESCGGFVHFLAIPQKNDIGMILQPQLI